MLPLHARRESPAEAVDTAHPSAGFSLVEVMIALIILVFGLVSLAQGSVLMVNQINVSDTRTERIAARNTAVERLRAMPFDSVKAGSLTVGEYSMRWTIPSTTAHTRLVQLLTAGPGTARGTRSTQVMANVVDTVSFRVIRP